MAGGVAAGQVHIVKPQEGVRVTADGEVSREPGPANTYEAPGCQETKISSERFFAIFSAWWIPALLAIDRVS